MANFSSTYPATKPVFQADFANGGRIDPRATFSRSDTPPTYAAPSAVHYWSNEKHLSSENLITDSNAFTGTATVRVVNTSGQADPAGGTDAVQLSQQAGQTIAGGVYWAYTLEVGREYTWSVYVKNDGRTFPYLADNFGSGGANRKTWFDTSSSGAVGTSDAGHTALITKLGDWYRITIRFTPIVASGNVYFYISSADNSTTVADDGNGFIAYGASLSTTGQLVHENTSGQIHREYAPTLKSVATAGQARFEYDPATNVSLGCLLESSSTNLSRYGSALGSWANLSLNARVESNVAIAPNGLLEADLLGSSNTTSATRYTGDYSISLTSGTTYTASVYLKAAGHRYAQLCGISTGWATTDYVNYDLQTGTVSAGGSATGTLSDVGNGWFRATATMTANGSVTGSFLLGMVGSLSDARLASFTGDLYAGILAWGFQTEASSFASSLTDTGTGSSQLTRAADSLSVATADIGYTGGPVSIVAEGEGGRGSYPRLLGMGGTSSNVEVYRNSSSASSATSFRVISVDPSGANATLTEESSVTKFGISVNTNSVKSCGDGGAVQSDTSAVIPILTSLRIGDQPTGGKQWNGHVKRVALYNEALSDTNLQALTS